MSDEIKKTRKRDLEKQKEWSKNYRDNNPDKNKKLTIHSIKEEDLEFFNKTKNDENLTGAEFFNKVIGVYKNTLTNVR